MCSIDPTTPSRISASPASGPGQAEDHVPPAQDGHAIDVPAGGDHVEVLRDGALRPRRGEPDPGATRESGSDLVVEVAVSAGAVCVEHGHGDLSSGDAAPLIELAAEPRNRARLRSLRRRLGTTSARVILTSVPPVPESSPSASRPRTPAALGSFGHPHAPPQEGCRRIGPDGFTDPGYGKVALDPGPIRTCHPRAEPHAALDASAHPGCGQSIRTTSAVPRRRLRTAATNLHPCGYGAVPPT
jgi:hypothetical protein